MMCVYVVALNPSQIRRDYYRGSQDCLAETRRTSTCSLYSGIYWNGHLSRPLHILVMSV